MSNKDLLFKGMIKALDEMANSPDKVTKEQESFLNKMYSALCKTLGISEHAQWRVNWKVEKFHDELELNNKTPYEIACATQNIILNNGATEMLKLIGGIVGSTAFDNANAVINVGDSSAAENSSQAGLQAITNKYAQKVDASYPQVLGNQLIYKSTFNNDVANFQWNEFCIQNGTGAGAIAMNRKVQNLGTKNGGIWSVQITLSITSTN